MGPSLGPSAEEAGLLVQSVSAFSRSLKTMGGGRADEETGRCARFILLEVVNTVGHLAEAAFHHPDLNVSYAFVIVKLKNHAAKGITNKDFELAHKIEEVLMWQPGLKAGSALEGTPDDARFKYLKYE